MKKYFYFCIFLNVAYLCESYEGCCEECCDCLYHEELVEKPSKNGLLIKKKDKEVIEIKTLQVIKNDKEVVEIKTLQEYIDNITKIIGKCEGTLLCGASILTKPNNIKGFEDMNKKVEKIFNDENNLDFNNLNFKDLSHLEKRSIGSMLGMGIGDAYGALYEFKTVNRTLYNAANYNKKFKSNMAWKWNNDKTRCGWTDDSSMGLCLADSLIVKNGDFDPQDIMRRFLAWWHCGYNNASMYQKTKGHSWGLGGNISESFKEYLKKPVDYTKAGGDEDGKYMSGNGSIMRNAAIPIAYHNDLNLAMTHAEEQSKVTHQGHEAAGCCRLLTYIVWNILNEKKKRYFKRYVR